jgi:hypothetical protein
MSNGHAPGIKLKKMSFVGITPEGIVSYKVEAADVARAVAYYAEWPVTLSDVDSTVVRNAGSTSPVGEAPPAKS